MGRHSQINVGGIELFVDLIVESGLNSVVHPYLRINGVRPFLTASLSPSLRQFLRLAPTQWAHRNGLEAP
jgi:hypothetical protein